MTEREAWAHGPRIRSYLEERLPEMTEFLRQLVSAESPSTEPDAQERVLGLLAGALGSAGYAVRRVRGRKTGGGLLARPGERRPGRPLQLLLGHCDTVWPRGTLRTMPLRVEREVIRGPGVFDMKGGLVQAAFALRALHSLELEPSVTPVFLVTSDEEIGSPESRRWIHLLARRSCRALVLEPALGLDGRLKTRRKTVGHFRVRAVGKAAHGGLAPEEGASAVLEMSHVIQTLHRMADPDRGITVNVGVVRGGIRPNVVPPEAVAEVDVRVLTQADGLGMQEAILGLGSTVPGTRLEVEGGFSRPPLEPTPRNRRLWEAARRAGHALGMELEEGTSGGASDGNFASQHTATLDGLGPVGDGAHAEHEFIVRRSLVERGALLALLMLLPPEVAGAAPSPRGDEAAVTG